MSVTVATRRPSRAATDAIANGLPFTIIKTDGPDSSDSISNLSPAPNSASTPLGILSVATAAESSTGTSRACSIAAICAFPRPRRHGQPPPINFHLYAANPDAVRFQPRIRSVRQHDRISGFEAGDFAQPRTPCAQHHASIDRDFPAGTHEPFRCARAARSGRKLLNHLHQVGIRGNREFE